MNVFSAREHLGIAIQTGGGTVGHSSVEDSVATLDLVRWHILNGPKPGSLNTKGGKGSGRT